MVRPRRFDAAALTAAGLAVAGRDGWSAVSQRRVAEELGVTPMALYRLARDADQLRRLVADAAAPAVPAMPVAAGDLSLVAVLRAWAPLAYHQLCRRPGLAAYVVAHWTELPAWLDIVERLLDVAAEDGREGAAAVATVNAVFAYVLVRAQLHDGLADAPRRRLQPLRDEPDRYPRLRRSRPEFTRARVDEHFRFGLDALLAGLGLAGTATS